MRRFIVYQVQILVINTLEIIYFGTQGLKGQFMLSFTVIAFQKKQKNKTKKQGYLLLVEVGHQKGDIVVTLALFMKYKLVFLYQSAIIAHSKTIFMHNMLKISSKTC